ncbi:MAG: RodZ domain-containing protein [Candidatus Acidiferrales bacterium]
MPSTPFGEHLKREREMRGVSLEEISAATRISTRFLAALESEQWDRLPGGVFNRGFIRAVARFLGLDEDSLVAEYALETRDRAEYRVAEMPAESRRGALGATVAILIALLVAGGWLAAARYGGKIRAMLHKQPVASASSSPNSNPPTNGVAANAGTPAPGSDAANAAPDPLATLVLKLDAGKPADVKIVADEKTVFDGHIAAGETKSFYARETLEISSSESSALLLELNGQTVPPLGQPGQPGSITLSRKDLKPSSGGPH